MTFNPTTIAAAALVALLQCAPAAYAQAVPSSAIRSAEALLQPGKAAAAQANGSPHDKFTLYAQKPEPPDDDGAVHLRFDRRYMGVRVLGGDIIVHLKPNGSLDEVTGSLKAPIRLSSVTPTVSQEQARGVAEADFKRQGRIDSVSVELVVAAQRNVAPEPVLAWFIRVEGARCGQRSRMLYTIDANSSVIRNAYEDMRTLVPIECDGKGEDASRAKTSKRPPGVDAATLAAATGTGNSLYYGSLSINTNQLSKTKFELRDTTRGSHFTSDFTAPLKALVDADNTWGDGTSADRATEAVDAAYGQSQTWDYYLKRHKRKGIAGDGAGYRSIVHTLDENGLLMDNAYWSGDGMWYGDGKDTFKPLVSLDVAGHEMTHGVTANTANLKYSDEAGGLNEATSDIFGTMVEFFANAPGDPPDYMIGEKIMKNGKTALRYMYQPRQDNTSFDCLYSGTGELDPHRSSGVGNHFFYLMAEGSHPAGMPVSPICKSSEIVTATDDIEFAGVGRDKAEKIWYLALTKHMDPETDYRGARVATLKAAAKLYGDDSTEVRTVDYAWLGVNASDKAKLTAYVDNLTWQTAQIVAPNPELVLMGRRGVANKSHWFAFYLDPNQSGESSLTAADADSDFDLEGYDSTGKKLLDSSKNAGGAKEKLTLKNAETTRKLFYVAVPYKSGNAPYSLRIKLI